MAHFDTAQYTEQLNPHRYTFHVPCLVCRTVGDIDIPAQELFEYRQGKLIQHAMRSVSVDNREWLISGICPTCWNEMFPPEEDEYEYAY